MPPAADPGAGGLGWVRPWIGAPYRAGARGPDAWDCYGLVAAVLRDRWGLDVPLWAGLDGRDAGERGRIMAALRAGAWTPVPAGQAAPGDVALLRLRGHPSHCAVVVATAPRILALHTHGRIGAHLSVLDGAAWGGRWAGTYRYVHRPRTGSPGIAGEPHTSGDHDGMAQRHPV